MIFKHTLHILATFVLSITLVNASDLIQKKEPLHKKQQFYKLTGGVRVIENQVFTTELKIEGTAWDHGIIRNNIFTNPNGKSLHIRNVHHLLIDNNEFHGQKSNAIKLRSKQTRGTDNIIIQNNYFHDTKYTAVFVQEPNTNTKILNNVFENITVPYHGHKQHAIYVKGPGFLIEGNTITDVPDGHGISIRTSGIVRGNIIKNAFEDGIKYYSDSDEAGTGTVIIENNVVIENTDNGIGFVAGNGPLIKEAIIRFNTIVNNTIGIHISVGLEAVRFEVYGNIIIDSGGDYYDFRTSPAVNIENLSSINDIGFVDYIGGDFRLLEGSLAIDYVMEEIPDIPPYDHQKSDMGAKPYNAGAYQNIEQKQQ